MIVLQYIIIFIIASLSAFYLYKKVKAQLTSGDCDSGCGKCGVAKSFDKIDG